MEFLEAVKQIQKTMELKNEELLYNRWIIGGYDKEEGFQEFKNKLIEKSHNTNKKPEEILSWLFEEMG